MAETALIDGIGWGDRLRQTPLGILLIVCFLVMLGCGSIAGGAYLLLRDGAVSAWAIGTGMVGGTAILYLAYNLLRLAHWSWVSLMVLLGLMAASSVIRVAVAPRASIAPIGEIVVEAAAAWYLTRPPIRKRFGRPGD